MIKSCVYVITAKLAGHVLQKVAKRVYRVTTDTNWNQIPPVANVLLANTRTLEIPVLVVQPAKHNTTSAKLHVYHVAPEHIKMKPAKLHVKHAGPVNIHSQQDPLAVWIVQQEKLLVVVNFQLVVIALLVNIKTKPAREPAKHVLKGNSMVITPDKGMRRVSYATPANMQMLLD